MQAPPELTPVDQVIALIGGLILLGISYCAIIARRSDDAEVRRQHRRRALQGSLVFLGFAYMAAVLVPDAVAWPADIGDQIRLYFNQLDTVPATADGELTSFYRAIADEVGVATGADEPQSPVDVILDPVRAIGLVVYTTIVATASLGLQLPRRLLAGLRAGSTVDTDSDD